MVAENWKRKVGSLLFYLRLKQEEEKDNQYQNDSERF